jgi:hypothetical protein
VLLIADESLAAVVLVLPRNDRTAACYSHVARGSPLSTIHMLQTVSHVT